MIRLIRRRLIIPRGDTGSFSIPTQGTVHDGDVAVFGIFDPLTHQTVVMKIVPATSQFITIPLIADDTIELAPKKYKWDLSIYKNPIYDEDGELIGAAEINSYYSAFKLPVCEITEVALDVNKERIRTRDLLVKPSDFSGNTCGCLQTVYPWEQLQRSQLEQQLYKIAQDGGYSGTEEDFLQRFSGGSVVQAKKLEDFEVPGSEANLYLDQETQTLYCFKEIESIDVGTYVGATIVGTSEDGHLYLYIPIRGTLVDDLIIQGGEA